MTEPVFKTMEVYPSPSAALREMPTFPDLPVLVYSGVLDQPGATASVFERTFLENNWTGCQLREMKAVRRITLKTHEVWGVCCGFATVRLGGAEGRRIELEEGDILILPAGIELFLVVTSPDFQVVSACPEYQINGLILHDGPFSLRNAIFWVESSPPPATDPLFGREGPLFDFWYD